MQRFALGGEQRADLSVGPENGQVVEEASPAVEQVFGALFQRDVFAGDPAGGDDAVVETRHVLAEQQAAFEPRRQLQAGGRGILQQNVAEGVIHLGQFSDMGGENAANFFRYDLARERGFVAFEIDAGGLDFAPRIQPELLADGFGHGAGFVLIHQGDGVLHLLVVIFVARICGIARPQGVPVIAAVVGIPAKDAPQLLPGEGLFPAGGQDASGQQPGITVGIGIELFA